MSTAQVLRARGHAHLLAVGLLLRHGTNIFLSCKQFLDYFGLKDNFLYYITGILQAASFLFLRVVLMGYILFRTVVIVRTQFFELPASSQMIVAFGAYVDYPYELVGFKRLLFEASYKAALRVARKEAEEKAADTAAAKAAFAAAKAAKKKKGNKSR